MTGLGVGPGGVLAEYATAVSGDGQTIVGMLDPESSRKPYKWTQAGGIVPLAPRFAYPSAISYDGSIILSGEGGGVNRDVSWDGSVIASNDYDSSEGFIESNGVRTWIGDLPGYDYRSHAAAISADGTMVVGQSAAIINLNGQEIETDLALYWTASEGLVPLGPWNGAIAKDISQPKIVIAGFGSPTPGAPSESFRWTPVAGMKAIRELLLAEGIDVAALGWTLDSAKAVSADGRVIVGTGVKAGGLPQAWLVELPIPGDFDDDGDSDGNDFLTWQRGVGTSYDAGDLADWRANIDFYNRVTPGDPPAAAVPEPHALSLLILVAAAIHLSGCSSSRRC